MYFNPEFTVTPQHSATDSFFLSIAINYIHVQGGFHFFMWSVSTMCSSIVHFVLNFEAPQHVYMSASHSQEFLRSRQ